MFYAFVWFPIRCNANLRTIFDMNNNFNEKKLSTKLSTG